MNLHDALSVFVGPLLALVGALLGAKWGGKWSKENEINAIQAKLDTVVQQNVAITTAAETIKNQMSTTAWGRNVRKEVIFDVLKSLSRIDAGMIMLIHNASEIPNADMQNPEVRKIYFDFKDAYEDFLRAKMLANVVCSEPVRSAFLGIADSFFNIGNDVADGKLHEARNAAKYLIVQMGTVADVVRHDLGIAI